MGGRSSLPFQRLKKPTHPQPISTAKGQAQPTRYSLLGLGKNVGKAEDQSWQEHRQHHAIRLFPPQIPTASDSLGRLPSILFAALSTPSCPPSKFPSAQSARIFLFLVNFTGHMRPPDALCVEESDTWATTHFSLTFYTELYENCQGPSLHLTRQPLPMVSTKVLPFVTPLANTGKFLRAHVTVGKEDTDLHTRNGTMEQIRGNTPSFDSSPKCLSVSLSRKQGSRCPRVWGVMGIN